MTTLIKYPFDPTGVKTSNLVSNELHTITNENYKLLIPKHGMFFGSSVILTNTSTGINLELGVDYNPIEFNQNYSIRTGKSIYQAIELNESIIGVDLSFTYQALGGDYSYSNENLLDKIADISLPNVATEFSTITDVPRGLNPSNHLHDIREIYGMEYIVNELDRIQNGIITSLYPAYLSLLSYIDGTLQDTNNRLSEAITASLDNRLADFLGNIDRTFIGIDRLLNYSASSYQEGKNVGNREFTINDLPEDKFTTVESLVGLKDTMVKNLISKLSVGLGLDYSNYNLPLLTTLKNLRNYARCTIVSYNQALFYEKQRDLTIYPSTVGRDTELVYTKTSVDDSSSIITAADRDQQNLHIATLKDGQIKLNWNKYIRSDDVSDFIYNTEIHLADFGMLNTTVSVAHSITKDHISLGSVENLPIVSKEEVLAHINTPKYLTFDNLLLFMNNLFSDKAEDFKPKFPGKTEYLIDNCVVVFSPPGFGSDQRCDFPDGQVLTRKTTRPTTTVTPEPTKPIPPLGTLLGRVCDTYTLIGIYADGWGGSYTEIIAPNSAECGYTPPPTHLPKDTELARNCDGTTLVGIYADGEGSTYNKMLEVNSVTCGYKPPLTNIPKGTQLSYTCSGDNKIGIYADGTGGTYEGLLEAKSAECGYEPEHAGVVIQADICNFEQHYKYNLVADGQGGVIEQITENNSIACGYVTPDPFGPYGTLVTKDYCIPGTTTMCDLRADGNGGTYQDNLRYLVEACGYVPPTTLDPNITINTLTTEITEKIDNSVQISASITNLVAGRDYIIKWFLKNINDSDFVEQTTTYLNSDRTGSYVDMTINPPSIGTVSVKARIVESLDTTKFFVSTPILIASKVASVGPKPTISITSSKTTIYDNTNTLVRLTAAINTLDLPKTFRVEWFSKVINSTTYTNIGTSNLSTDKTSSEFDTTLNSPTTGFISIQARLVNTAVNTDYVVSQPLTITVEVKPNIGVPTFDLVIDPTEIESGKNTALTLSASISNLDPAHTYTVTWLLLKPPTPINLAPEEETIAPLGDEISNTPTANKGMTLYSNTYFTTTGTARFGLRITRKNSIPAVTTTDYASLKINPGLTKLQLLNLTSSTPRVVSIVNNAFTTGNTVTLELDLTDFPVSSGNLIKMYRNDVWIEDINVPTNNLGKGSKTGILYDIIATDTARFPTGPLVYEARYPLNPAIKSSVTFSITRDTRTPTVLLTNALSNSIINVTNVVSGNVTTQTAVPSKVKLNLELRGFDSSKGYYVAIKNNLSTSNIDNIGVYTDTDGNWKGTTPKEYNVPNPVSGNQLSYTATVLSVVSSPVDYTVLTASKNKTFNMLNMNANSTLTIIDGEIDPTIAKIKFELVNLAGSTSYPILVSFNRNTYATDFTLTTDASGYATDTKDIPVRADMTLTNNFTFSSTVDGLEGSVTYTAVRKSFSFNFTTTTKLNINVVNNVSDVPEVNFSLDLVAMPNKKYMVKLYGNMNLMGQVDMVTNSEGVASVPKSYPINGAVIAHGTLVIKADIYKLDNINVIKSVPITFNVNRSTVAPKVPKLTMTIKSGSLDTINMQGTTPTPQFTTIQVVGTDFKPNTQYTIDFTKPNGTRFNSLKFPTDPSGNVTNSAGGFTVLEQVSFYNSAAIDYIALTGSEGSISVGCTVNNNGVNTTSSVTIYVTKSTPPPTSENSVVKTFNIKKTDSVSTINIDANNTVSPSQVGVEFSGTGWYASSYIISIEDDKGRSYPSLNVYPINGTFGGQSSRMNITIPSNTNSGTLYLNSTLDGITRAVQYTVTKTSTGGGGTLGTKEFNMAKTPAISTLEMLANGTGNPSSFGVTFSVKGYTPYSSVPINVGRDGPNANDSSYNYDNFNINTLSDGTGSITRTYYPDSSWRAGTLVIKGRVDLSDGTGSIADRVAAATTYPKSVSIEITKITVAPTIVITANSSSYVINLQDPNGSYYKQAYLTININGVPANEVTLINFYKNNGPAGPNNSGVQFTKGGLYPLSNDGLSANYVDTLVASNVPTVTYTADFLYRGIVYRSDPFTVYVSTSGTIGGSSSGGTSTPVKPTIRISSNVTSFNAVNTNTVKTLDKSSITLTFIGTGPVGRQQSIDIYWTWQYNTRVYVTNILVDVASDGSFSKTITFKTELNTSMGWIDFLDNVTRAKMFNSTSTDGTVNFSCTASTVGLQQSSDNTSLISGVDIQVKFQRF